MHYGYILSDLSVKLFAQKFPR